ncbi:glycosyltransferase family 2 protein [Miltoncostaea marina]|uniref:glycosyltransferase family 2 protein n=1 Tax=Miltoncostaea marina TaxID=2843215 RepID=UPI001C3E63C9|nr:glycosyltransferase [Miltoncostaea marina]
MISIVVISKDEPALDGTLAEVSAHAAALPGGAEVVVVDASAGRLDHVRRAHPGVRWIDWSPPPGVAVSIPHQRNAGVAAARGDVIVFTDAGCRPAEGWLERLVAPLLSGEEAVAAGVATSPDGDGLYDSRTLAAAEAAVHLPECPTINMAFRRAAFDDVGGFDERFQYGSDIDFSWRLVEAGHRIRSVPRAVVTHDWGSPTRQLRRGYRYGRARARLYRKHRRRLPRALRGDPMVFVYPLFLLGLPLTLRWRAYPLLLLVPAWRNRADGPLRVVADHLAFGLGVLREAWRR